MRQWIYRLIFPFLGLASVAFADSGNPSTLDLSQLNPLGCGNLGCVAAKIVSGLLTISVPIASIMILVGAFYMLTSGGNEERFAQGKKVLLYAVIGFAVVLISQVATSLINDILSGGSGT
jgi:hypothetical protein